MAIAPYTHTSHHTLESRHSRVCPPQVWPQEVQVSRAKLFCAKIRQAHADLPARIRALSNSQIASTAEHIVRRELHASSWHRRTEPSVQFGLHAANLPGAGVLGRHAARRAHVDDLPCALFTRSILEVGRGLGRRRVRAGLERTDGDSGWEEREGQAHDV